MRGVDDKLHFRYPEFEVTEWTCLDRLRGLWNWKMVPQEERPEVG